MHFLTLLALAIGALGAALPTEENSTLCGVAYPRPDFGTDDATDNSIIQVFSDGQCHTTPAIMAFLNQGCGLCVWFDGENCTGKHTYSGGAEGRHDIPTSYSYRCAFV